MFICFTMNMNAQICVEHNRPPYFLFIQFYLVLLIFFSQTWNKVVYVCVCVCFGLYGINSGFVLHRNALEEAISHTNYVTDDHLFPDITAILFA